MSKGNTKKQFVRWFRGAAPYINAFRGRTFVVVFGGEVVADAQFPALAHDIALLDSLGVRLVLVHGTRPQIEERLRVRGAEIRYVNGLRVTDDDALICVKEAAGSTRVEIEALLSMGLASSPMAGAGIRTASGNFVTARPLGIREGVDYCHTGEVRRVDGEAIHKQLADGAIVLLSPLGYSPTGEVFNLAAEDVATAVASELGGDKLIFLVDGEGLHDERGRLIPELSLSMAREMVTGAPSEEAASVLASAVYACEQGVRRAHLIDRHRDGALLLELFTRDGVGTLITGDTYEGMRPAAIDDIGGILELITPLEVEGILVRRSREKLETEIDRFVVVERDGGIIACAALYPYADVGAGELACLVVHPDYRDEARGGALLDHIEEEAKQQGMDTLFVLTTRGAHWFQERGFLPARIGELPIQRQDLYNYQRNAKVFVKDLRGCPQRKR